MWEDKYGYLFIYKSESNSFYLLDYGKYEKDECVASYIGYYKNLEDCWNDVSESKKCLMLVI